jgi:hydroxymethylpyrimidine pyrophosphatase-like HAD family hydrolase
MFTVVATDLDGTLLRSDLTVSPRSRRALAAVRDRGARHLVVTGRQVAGCGQLLSSLGYHGVAVCGQGAQIYDTDSGRLLWSATLDRDVARAVVERVQAELGPLRVGVATAGCDGHVRVPPGFYSNPGVDCEIVAPDRLWAEPIEKVFLRHPGLDAAALVDEVARLAGGAVTPTHSQRSVVELLPPNVSKGHGFARAAELLGFSPGESIAFGDMPNDLPMFELAGYAVAMGNADARVRAAADEVGPSNDDDGVAAVLERLYLLQGAQT